MQSNGTPLQYSCLENPMDRGAWQAAVHGVVKSWTGLSNFTITFHFHALEKEMATHSSVFAWRIPRTGEGLVGCCLRGCTESDTTDGTQQQQQHLFENNIEYLIQSLSSYILVFPQNSSSLDIFFCIVGVMLTLLGSSKKTNSTNRRI